MRLSVLCLRKTHIWVLHRAVNQPGNHEPTSNHSDTALCLWESVLLCKYKRQYLPTCKVSRYCLFGFARHCSDAARLYPGKHEALCTTLTQHQTAMGWACVVFWAEGSVLVGSGCWGDSAARTHLVILSRVSPGSAVAGGPLHTSLSAFIGVRSKTQVFIAPRSVHCSSKGNGGVALAGTLESYQAGWSIVEAR